MAQMDIGASTTHSTKMMTENGVKIAKKSVAEATTIGGEKGTGHKPKKQNEFQQPAPPSKRNLLQIRPKPLTSTNKPQTEPKRMDFFAQQLNGFLVEQQPAGLNIEARPSAQFHVSHSPYLLDLDAFSASQNIHTPPLLQQVYAPQTPSGSNASTSPPLSFFLEVCNGGRSDTSSSTIPSSAGSFIPTSSAFPSNSTAPIGSYSSYFLPQSTFDLNHYFPMLHLLPPIDPQPALRSDYSQPFFSEHSAQFSKLKPSTKLLQTGQVFQNVESQQNSQREVKKELINVPSNPSVYFPIQQIQNATNLLHGPESSNFYLGTSNYQNNLPACSSTNSSVAFVGQKTSCNFSANKSLKLSSFSSSKNNPLQPVNVGIQKIGKKNTSVPSFSTLTCASSQGSTPTLSICQTTTTANLQVGQTAVLQSQQGGLNLFCDRLSPSSSSCASIDSGFYETSFPSSPEMTGITSASMAFSGLFATRSNSGHVLNSLTGRSIVASSSASTFSSAEGRYEAEPLPKIRKICNEFQETEIISSNCQGLMTIDTATVPHRLTLREKHSFQVGDSLNSINTKMSNLPNPLIFSLSNSTSQSTEEEKSGFLSSDNCVKAKCLATTMPLEDACMPIVILQSSLEGAVLSKMEIRESNVLDIGELKAVQLTAQYGQKSDAVATEYEEMCEEEKFLKMHYKKEEGKKPTEEKEATKNLRCGWNKCTFCFANDNQLYDHVVKEHLGKPCAISTNERKSKKCRKAAGAASSKIVEEYAAKEPSEEAEKLRCKWENCEMFMQRGDIQKQKSWLLHHFTARHAPRAQPFICLFVDCSLRFRTNRTLIDHLRSAHDNNVRSSHVKKSNDENKILSPFEFRQNSRIMPKLCSMDRYTALWVRERVKAFNNSVNASILNLEEGQKAMRADAMQNVRIRLRKSSAWRSVAKTPPQSDVTIDLNNNNEKVSVKKMELSETVVQLRKMFARKVEQTCSAITTKAVSRPQ